MPSMMPVKKLEVIVNYSKCGVISVSDTFRNSTNTSNTLC